MEEESSPKSLRELRPPEHTTQSKRKVNDAECACRLPWSKDARAYMPFRLTGPCCTLAPGAARDQASQRRREQSHLPKKLALSPSPSLTPTFTPEAWDVWIQTKITSTLESSPSSRRGALLALFSFLPSLKLNTDSSVMEIPDDRGSLLKKKKKIVLRDQTSF